MKKSLNITSYIVDLLKKKKYLCYEKLKKKKNLNK